MFKNDGTRDQPIRNKFLLRLLNKSFLTCRGCERTKVKAGEAVSGVRTLLTCAWRLSVLQGSCSYLPTQGSAERERHVVAQGTFPSAAPLLHTKCIPLRCPGFDDSRGNGVRLWGWRIAAPRWEFRTLVLCLMRHSTCSHPLLPGMRHLSVARERTRKKEREREAGEEWREREDCSMRKELG